MPACSPCGLAVDWSRRCYESEWHLFRDALHITTAGRYYRPPPGTPFVDVEHFYGSREWQETNWPKQQALGESLIALHAYDKGQPPEALPDTNIVGSSACISGGETIGNALPYSAFFDGFPSSCFINSSRRNRDWSRVSTYLSCGLQLFYIKIIEFLYADDPVSVNDAFDMLLPGGNVTVVPGEDPYTSYCVVVYDGFCVVVTDGSRPYQQLAMQGFQSLQPPQNFGAYATLPLWYDNSTRIIRTMREMGVTLEYRVMLAGHSYGAATVNNIVGRLKAAAPDSIVRYLNYGAPKGGDARLARLVNLAEGIQLCNTDDLVCAVPPTFGGLFALMVLTGIDRLENWDTWRHPRTCAMQDEAGELTWEHPPEIDFATLFGMLAKILALQPFDTILAHFTEVYRRRISARCPACDWPISAELCRWLRRVQVGLQLGTAGAPALVRIILGGNEPSAVPELIFGVPTSAVAETGLVIGVPDEPPGTGLVIGVPDEPPGTGLVIGDNS